MCKESNMKSITKFISCLECLLIAMVFMFSFSACNNDPIESGNNETPGNNETQNIYELYGSGNYSFANIDITSVRDIIYCDLDDLNKRYVVLEGIVADDYYCKLNKGTAVNIPVCLNKTEDSYLDVNSVIELFSQSETIFVYFCVTNDKELFLYPQNDKVQFSCLTSVVNFNYFDIILCTNGRTDLNKICTFLNSQSMSYVPFNLYGEYTNYIDDQMDIETVANNLTKLYEKIKKYKEVNS